MCFGRNQIRFLLKQRKLKWLRGKTELFSTLKTIYPLPTNPNSFMLLEWLNLGIEVYEMLHG